MRAAVMDAVAEAAFVVAEGVAVGNDIAVLHQRLIHEAAGMMIGGEDRHGAGAHADFATDVVAGAERLEADDVVFRGRFGRAEKDGMNGQRRRPRGRQHAAHQLKPRQDVRDGPVHERRLTDVAGERGGQRQHAMTLPEVGD